MSQHDTSPPQVALSSLAAEITGMLGPEEVTILPCFSGVGGAARAACEVGVADAQSDTFDIFSHDARLPHQNTVATMVLDLPHIVGRRARLILATYSQGRLTPYPQLSPPAIGWRGFSKRTLLLMAAAALTEMWIGAAMAERLVNASDLVSWLFGVVTATVLTLAAFGAAKAIDRHVPGLLRGHGSWVAGGVGATALTFLTIYAIGLGGGAEADPTGGITGGSNATGGEPAAGGPDVQLTLVYLSLLSFLLATVVLSHLDDLAGERESLVAARIAARTATLDFRGQTQLAVELLEACLVLKDQARDRCRSLIHAYVGGARTGLPPQLSSLWDTEQLENQDIPEPPWVNEIRAELKRLRELASEPQGPHDRLPS